MNEPAKSETMTEIHVAKVIKKEPIVIATSVIESEFVELITKSLHAFGDIDWPVIIKPHPTTPKKWLEHFRELPPNWVFITTQPLEEVLNGAGVLIYMTTSSVFTAIQLGVPYVFVQSDLTIPIDNLAGTKWENTVGTPAELRLATGIALLDGPKITPEEAQEIIKEFYGGPPDYGILNQIVDRQDAGRRQ